MPRHMKPTHRTPKKENPGDGGRGAARRRVVGQFEISPDNKDLISEGRSELPDLGGKAARDCISGTQPKVCNTMNSPFVVAQRDVLPENGFGSIVVNRNAVCDGLKALGRCRLRGRLGPMHHERCVCASLAFLGAEVGNDTSGANAPNVVQSEFNR